MGLGIRFVNDKNETLLAPFPTEPVLKTENRADGTVAHMFLSPPVQESGYAHRYRAWRIHRADGTIHAFWNHERHSGWKDYHSRENWAASCIEYTWDTQYQKAQPFALVAKWREPMLEFVHAHEPETAKAAVQETRDFVERVRDRRRSGANTIKDHEQRFGKVEHGDLVLTMRPIEFADGRVSQAFVMLKLNSKKLEPYIPCANGQLVGVRIRRTTKRSFYKVGLEAFEVIENLSSHEKIRLLSLAQEMRERFAKVQETID